MSYPTFTPGRLNILTYNVCWEALEARKGMIDMNHCRVGTINKCTENLASIMTKQHYDFIALQEIREDNTKQWQTLLTELTKRNPNFTLEYGWTGSQQGLFAGIMLIYNKRFTLKTANHGDILAPGIAEIGREGRPYTIAVFQTNATHGIIYINVHFPHRNEILYSKQSNFEQVISELIKTRLQILPEFKDPNYPIIMSGDFNRDPRAFIQNILEGSGKRFFINPTNIGTCCDPIPGGAHPYNMNYDYIFNTIAMPREYYTLSPTEIAQYQMVSDKTKKLISDHLPIMAQIEIPVMNDTTISDIKLKIIGNINGLSDTELVEALHIETIYRVFKKGDFDDKLVVLIILQELVARLNNGTARDPYLISIEPCVRKYLERFKSLGLAVPAPRVPLVPGPAPAPRVPLVPGPAPAPRVPAGPDCKKLNKPHWEDNSCYLNSTLWALFHKKDNPFIQRIQSAGVEPNEKPSQHQCNKTNFKNEVIIYYNAIQNGIPFPIKKIRKFLQDCTTMFGMDNEPRYWTHQQMDNSEFLQKLVAQLNLPAHQLFTKIEIKNYSTPETPGLPPTASKQDTIREFMPTYQWNIVNNRKLDIQLLNATDFIISSPKTPITLYAPIDFGSFKGKYREMSEATQFNNPDCLIMNVGRTGFNRGVPVKLTDPIQIEQQIGSLELFSIVVHHGANTSAGHYICYFKCVGRWYLMDDTNPNIEEVDIMREPVRSDISKNSTTLVYFIK